MQISLSPAAVAPGQQSTLTWNTPAACSDTARLCVATGSWGGVVPSSGSKVVTQSGKGEYTYGLNCGGTERNAATLVVGTAPATLETTVQVTIAK